jgi:hypothetical protein
VASSADLPFVHGAIPQTGALSVDDALSSPRAVTIPTGARMPMATLPACHVCQKRDDPLERAA